MLQLALDSSNQALSLALLEDQQVLAQVLITVKKNHSINLMPSIDYLMASCDKKPQDLDRIVVAEGPGSYTGIRMAVATAKTLAYALDLDLVGMSSLAALLNPALTGIQVPLIDARRQHVYAGIYKDGMALEADGYTSMVDLLDRVKNYEQVTFVGEVEAFRSLIEELCPQAQIEARYPDAASLARLSSGKPGQAVHAFEPAYLKKVEAEENWLKNHEEGDQSYIKRL